MLKRGVIIHPMKRTVMRQMKGILDHVIVEGGILENNQVKKIIKEIAQEVRQMKTKKINRVLIIGVMLNIGQQ